MRPAHVTNAIACIHARAAGSIAHAGDLVAITAYITELERERDSHRCSLRSWLRSMLHPSEKRRRDDVADRRALASRVPRFAEDPYTGNSVDVTGPIGRQKGNKAGDWVFTAIVLWLVALVVGVATASAISFVRNVM